MTPGTFLCIWGNQNELCLVLNSFMRNSIAVAAWKFGGNKPQQTNYIVNHLYQQGLLNCLIHLGDERRAYKKLVSPSKVIQPGKSFVFFWKALGKARGVVSPYKIRSWQEVLFDRYLAGHLSSTATLLFCDLPSFLLAIRNAKRGNMKTVVHEQMAHPDYNYRILEEESKRFRVNLDTVFMGRGLMERRKTVLSECDHIIALSDSVTKKSLESFGVPPEKVSVVPLGVDTNYYAPLKKDPDCFRVLFVGNGTLIKGVPYLLDAWKQLKMKNAELIVCGEQNKSIINRFDLLPNVYFKGVVQPLAYYQSSSIFVLPSLSDAFSRAVLEAMSCALPVIISEGVGANDIIDEGEEGFVVPRRDSCAIAEWIEYLHRNPEKRKEMGKKARRKAERFTWERYGAGVAQVLEKVVVA